MELTRRTFVKSLGVLIGGAVLAHTVPFHGHFYRMGRIVLLDHRDYVLETWHLGLHYGINNFDLTYAARETVRPVTLQVWTPELAAFSEFTRAPWLICGDTLRLQWRLRVSAS